MADTYTPNLNLKKPGYESFADIGDINGNMDKIDEAYKRLDEKSPVVDTTLTKRGQAADAKATGDALSALKNDMADKLGKTETAADSDKLGGKASSYYASESVVAAHEASIGDAWTSGKTYTIGTYCIHENRLYKCKTEHTSGSSFTSSYWDSISITSDLSNKCKYYRYDIEMTAGDKYFFPPEGTYFVIIRTQCGDYGGQWNMSCVQNDFINVLDTCDISWKTSYGVGIVTLTGQLTIVVQALPTDPRNAQAYLIRLS